MAHTLAVLGQKGGSGKSTLVVGLAVAHELAGGQAGIVDLDPQASSLTWGRLRGDKSPSVAAAHPPRLAQVAAQASGASLVAIDGPPREAAGTAEAARVADLVVIPSRPAAVDLAAIPATLAVVAAAGTRVAVVLNACSPRGPWTGEAADAARSFGAEVCPVTLGARIAHAKAYMLGRTAQETEPRSPAAAEIGALYSWIMETMS